MKGLKSVTLALILLAVFSIGPVYAQGIANSDTEDSYVEAIVTEVTDSRISVIASTGVEHVIAVKDNETVVRINGRPVSLRDLQVDDVVDIELDPDSTLKFARSISLVSDQGLVARNRHD
jgi:hypothetical protein